MTHIHVTTSNWDKVSAWHQPWEASFPSEEYGLNNTALEWRWAQGYKKETL